MSQVSLVIFLGSARPPISGPKREQQQKQCLGQYLERRHGSRLSLMPPGCGEKDSPEPSAVRLARLRSPQLDTREKPGQTNSATASQGQACPTLPGVDNHPGRRAWGSGTALPSPASWHGKHHIFNAVLRQLPRRYSLASLAFPGVAAAVCTSTCAPKWMYSYIPKASPQPSAFRMQPA